MRVPGSPFFNELDHAFSWCARVRNRNTGEERTYWTNGSQATREDVAAHIAAQYRNVDVLTIDRVTKPPDQPLRPVPREDYGVGALEVAMKELRQMAGDPLARALGLKPIGLSPIQLKPLTRR